ncbi:MAG TPA: hypothetical protein VJ783_01660 [Pirellulales bacterium]|nr:hypothetical protein [Pirellulales bacterium]
MLKSWYLPVVLVSSMAITVRAGDDQPQAADAQVSIDVLVAEVADDDWTKVSQTLCLDSPKTRSKPVSELIESLQEKKLIKNLSSPAVKTVNGRDIFLAYDVDGGKDESGANAPGRHELVMIPEIKAGSVLLEVRFKEKLGERMRGVNTVLELKPGEMGIIAPRKLTTHKLICLTPDIAKKKQASSKPQPNPVSRY